MTALDRLLGKEMPLNNDPWAAAAGTAAMSFRDEVERFCCQLSEDLGETVLSTYTMDAGIIITARSGWKATIMLIVGSHEAGCAHIKTTLDLPHQEVLTEIFLKGDIKRVKFDWPK